MDNASLHNFRNLAIEPKPVHWLDVPTGCVSGMAKANLGHQMRYSVETLEAELVATTSRHALQIVFEGGTDRDPEHWALHADGRLVADGSGEFARSCFQERTDAFRDVCRDAVKAAEACGLPPLDERDFRLLSACRAVAAIEKRGL